MFNEMLFSTMAVVFVSVWMLFIAAADVLPFSYTATAFTTVIPEALLIVYVNSLVFSNAKASLTYTLYAIGVPASGASHVATMFLYV